MIKMIKMIALCIKTLTKDDTSSKHNLDPACADQSLAGPRRPRRPGSPWSPCFGPHIDANALAGWRTPYEDPATPPCQSRPRCPRPLCSQQQRITNVLDVDSVVPDSVPNLVLQLLLLLHPELPVAILKGECQFQHGRYAFC